jgi:hypothetical protein
MLVPHVPMQVRASEYRRLFLFSPPVVVHSVAPHPPHDEGDAPASPGALRGKHTARGPPYQTLPSEYAGTTPSGQYHRTTWLKSAENPALFCLTGSPLCAVPRSQPPWCSRRMTASQIAKRPTTNRAFCASSQGGHHDYRLERRVYPVCYPS